MLENTDNVHNVIVCTLCSCTAYTIIGAAPDWYKDIDYRARVVRAAIKTGLTTGHRSSCAASPSGSA